MSQMKEKSYAKLLIKNVLLTTKQINTVSVCRKTVYKLMLYLPNAQFVYSKDKFFPEAFNATSHSISSFLKDKKTKVMIEQIKPYFYF